MMDHALHIDYKRTYQIHFTDKSPTEKGALPEQNFQALFRTAFYGTSESEVI